MRSIDTFKEIYLYRDVVDFRKSMDGLAIIVQEKMKLNIFGPTLFIFCSRNKQKLKIIYWDKTGLCLWYKRLSEDRFKWPRKIGDEVFKIGHRELEWLLEGIDITKIAPHEEKNYLNFKIS